MKMTSSYILLLNSRNSCDVSRISWFGIWSRDIFLICQSSQRDHTSIPVCLEPSWFTPVAPSLWTPLLTLKIVLIWTINSTISLLRAQVPESWLWQIFPWLGMTTWANHLARCQVKSLGKRTSLVSSGSNASMIAVPCKSKTEILFL